MFFQTKGGILRPTDSDLFSWVASIARKFEEFKFSSLRFVYEPHCSTATNGAVGLFFDGDPTHTPPANWNNFINTGANVHGAPWAKHVLQVPNFLCSSRASYYTQSEFPDANANNALGVRANDPLEYFPGIYGWVCEGTLVGAAPNNVQALGKVYLEYTCSFKTQNVDGFNITSLGGAQLSAESAINSGSGYLNSLGTFSAGAGVLWGASPALTQIQAGSKIFQQVSSGYWVALQSVEVMMSLRANSAAALTLSLQWAPPPLGNTAPAWANIPATNMVAGGIATSGGAITNRVQSWYLKIPAGYYIRVNTDVALTAATMFIFPCTFSLNLKFRSYFPFVENGSYTCF